ncbi:hypothetical protein ABPG74_002448 [Tetrahymena malaccensis]
MISVSQQTIKTFDSNSIQESWYSRLSQTEIIPLKDENIESKIHETFITNIDHTLIDKYQNLHVYFNNIKTDINQYQIITLDACAPENLQSEIDESEKQKIQEQSLITTYLNSKNKGSKIVIKVTNFQGKKFIESIHHSESFMKMLQVESDQFQIDFHTMQIQELAHFQLINQFINCLRSIKIKKSLVCNVAHSLGRDIVIKGQISQIQQIQTDMNSSNQKSSQLFHKQENNLENTFSTMYFLDIFPIDNQFLMNPNLSNRRKELLKQKQKKISIQEKAFLNTIKQFQSTLDKNLEDQLSRDYKICGYKKIKTNDE